MFFLGAGASVDAGLPTSTDLTLRFLNRLRNEQVTNRQVLEAATLVQKTLSGPHESRSVNFEQFLSAAVALADRSELEISPFVVQWSPQVESFDKRNPTGFEELVIAMPQGLPRILEPAQKDGEAAPHSNTTACSRSAEQGLTYLFVPE